GHARPVELGRALVGRPTLLLLDEPSSGLDRAESLALAALLRTLPVQHGTAVLLVEHDLEMVERVVTRLYVLDAGSVLAEGPVRFGHVDVTRLAAWRLARLGVAHAPEGRSVFASLSVEENLVLSFRAAVGRDGAAAAVERAYARFPWLRDRRRQSAATLSGGEQRMLALARVLAAPPRLRVVDELSLGLAPAVVDEVFAALAEIQAVGTPLLLVEPHVYPALALAAHLVVLT